MGVCASAGVSVHVSVRVLHFFACGMKVGKNKLEGPLARSGLKPLLFQHKKKSWQAHSYSSGCEHSHALALEHPHPRPPALQVLLMAYMW